MVTSQFALVFGSVLTIFAAARPTTSSAKPILSANEEHPLLKTSHGVGQGNASRNTTPTGASKHGFLDSAATAQAELPKKEGNGTSQKNATGLAANHTSKRNSRHMPKNAVIQESKLPAKEKAADLTFYKKACAVLVAKMNVTVARKKHRDCFQDDISTACGACHTQVINGQTNGAAGRCCFYYPDGVGGFDATAFMCVSGAGRCSVSKDTCCDCRAGCGDDYCSYPNTCGD